MLVALGTLMIIVILVLLITGRASPVTAFVLVPLVTALIAGFGLAEIGEFAIAGLESVVSITAMIVFAVLFFSILLEAGTFEPIVNRVVGFAGETPVSIAVVTFLLTAAISFDGDSSSSYLILATAVLPLYNRLGMNPLIFTAIVSTTAGVQNMVPWGGPTARAGAAIDVPPNELWVPMIPVQIVGLLAMLGVAYYLGRREKTRLEGLANGEDEKAAGGETADDVGPAETPGQSQQDAEDLTRPNLFWVNLVLMLVTIVALISAVLPPELVFMIAFVLVLLINYPNPQLQLELIQKHSSAPILLTTILLSSGVFLGIATESGMFDAITKALANALPAALAPLLPLFVGLLSTPSNLFIEINAYYFGMLPILAGVAEQAGIAPEAVAKASMIGQGTAGLGLHVYTASFFLLIALAKVSIGAHLRFVLPWALLVGTVMTLAAFAFGQIPLFAS